VYEEIQACLDSEFPLRASDRLQENLYLDPDDLDMVIAMRLSERTGRSLREPKRNPYYDRVITVGELVNFINSPTAYPSRGSFDVPYGEIRGPRPNDWLWPVRDAQPDQHAMMLRNGINPH
jgi:hypothetical protein